MSNNYSFLIHKDSKAKYKGGFKMQNGRMNNTSAYNHDYYTKNKFRWKDSENWEDYDGFGDKEEWEDVWEQAQAEAKKRNPNYTPPEDVDDFVVMLGKMGYDWDKHSDKKLENMFKASKLSQEYRNAHRNSNGKRIIPPEEIDKDNSIKEKNKKEIERLANEEIGRYAQRHQEPSSSPRREANYDKAIYDNEKLQETRAINDYNLNIRGYKRKSETGSKVEKLDKYDTLPHTTKAGPLEYFKDRMNQKKNKVEAKKISNAYLKREAEISKAAYDKTLGGKIENTKQKIKDFFDPNKKKKKKKSSVKHSYSYAIRYKGEDELYHYGVPGMRWGFRKNPERALQKTIRQLEKYGQRAEKGAKRASDRNRYKQAKLQKKATKYQLKSQRVRAANNRKLFRMNDAKAGKKMLKYDQKAAKYADESAKMAKMIAKNKAKSERNIKKGQKMYAELQKQLKNTPMSKVNQADVNRGREIAKKYGFGG